MPPVAARKKQNKNKNYASVKGALGDLCVRERIAEIGRFTSTWKEVAAAAAKDKDVADATVRFASHRQKIKK